MRIKDVEIPEQLIDAHRQGKLVIFAGAGVSIDPPSSLPDFKKLAIQISGDPREVPKQDEPIDYYLGRLKTRGVNVHQRAHDIIARSDSKPNLVHTKILSLFSSPETTRIVTTNFDLHFLSAAKQIWTSPIETFCAPALPLGNNFHGIVFLHGCLNHSANDLVITDSDFGKAYLTEGWARRFLQTMFGEFTILFVGYSHSDTVMNYLSRALPPGLGHRYAMTLHGNEEHWNYVGIQPIIYNCPTSGDHSVVTKFFETWSDLTKMGSLDHERKIKELVELPPPLDTEAQDYLKDAIRTISNVRFFVQHAKITDWLNWVEQNSKEFVQLFEPSNTVVYELGQAWAWWFTQNFVWINSDEGLAFLCNKQLRMSRFLWTSIATRVWINHQETPDSIKFGEWVSVLIDSTPLKEYETLGLLLKSCRHPDDKKTMVLLFEHLTNPCLKLGPHFKFSEKDKRTIDVDVSIQEEKYWLKESWSTWFKPNLSEYAMVLAPVVENHLRVAHYLLFSFGRANQDYDPLIIRRPAIEPHNQNDRSGSNLVLIDASRDILEYLIVNKPEYANNLIQAWNESSIPMLEKLSVHGMGKNNSEAGEKIQWLIKKNWLFKSSVKHEVFSLLRTNYPLCSEQIRQDLLKAILQWAEPKEGIDPRLADYMKYNILVWLKQADPNCQQVGNAFNDIQKANPNFQPREHPDLDSWMSSGFRGPSSPLSIEELLAIEPSEAIDFLLCYDDYHFDGPDREGLLEVVRKTVSRSHEWSLKLIEALRKVDPQELGLDLWKQTIDGWEETPLTETQLTHILELFKEFPLLDQLTTEIIYFINKNISDNQINFSNITLIAINDFTQVLWEKLPQPAMDHPVDDWLGFAINHPSGKLTEIWLHLLSRRIKESQTEKKAVFSNFQGHFDTILSDNTINGKLGRVIMAANLQFLHWLEPNWTEEKVFVVFDWTQDTDRAKEAWSGFLVLGKWSTNMLPKLLPLYTMTFNDFENRLNSELRQNFCRHLASIALFGVLNPIRDGWLWDFLKAVNADTRKTWAAAVNEQLNSIEEETAKNIWDRWLEEYWTCRNTGIPVPLITAELEQMIGWCIGLIPVFDKIVEKIVANPPPSLKNTHLYNDLKNDELIKAHSAALAKLLIHLLPNATTPFWQCREAINILEGLAKTNIPRSEIAKICDELARLGCGGSELKQGLNLS